MSIRVEVDASDQTMAHNEGMPVESPLLERAKVVQIDRDRPSKVGLVSASGGAGSREGTV
jgi:hypothetical protein